MTRQTQADFARLIGILLSRPDQLARAEALFQFMAAIRHPAGGANDLASRVYMARYVGEKLAWTSENLPFLEQYANAKEVLHLALSESWLDVFFGDPSSRAGDEKRVAQIVRFLLSFPIDPDDRRRGPSLKKAYIGLSRLGAFGSVGPTSWIAFTDVWGKYKRVAAFHFADEYGFKQQLRFGIEDKKFVAKTDRLLARSHALERYFRHALWVVKEMRAILYRGTFKPADIPAFPEDLVPWAVPITPIDPQIVAEILNNRTASW